MRIYLVVLSEQLPPSIIPILGNPPDRAIALVSEAMERSGKDRIFRAILERYGIPAETVGGAPVSGYPDIQRYAQDFAGYLRRAYPGAEIVLNITGGTKLMTLALVEAFRDTAQQWEYTDTGRRTLEIVPNEGAQMYRSEPLRSVLDVPTHLAAQGFHVDSIQSDTPGWEQAALQRKPAADYLAESVVRLESFFGVLNATASKALSPDGKCLVAPVQYLDSHKKPPTGLWQRALEHLVAVGVLHWSAQDPYVLEFPDTESARFLNGGWLEEYVWHVLRDLGLFDVRLGVEGRWEGQGESLNEFDVLATQDNTMLYLECKTGIHDAEKDSRLSYKTGSLGPNVRGSFGQTWVVSARRPTENLMQRAQQFRFRVIVPEEIPQLGALVRSWAAGSGP